MKGLAERVV